MDSLEATPSVCHASLSVDCVCELSHSAWHDPASVLTGQQEGQLSASRKPGQQLTNNGEAWTQDKMLTNSQVTTRASPVGALLSMLGLGRVASFWGRVGSLASKHHGTALTQLPSRELDKKTAQLDSESFQQTELAKSAAESFQQKELAKSAAESLQQKELSQEELSQKELSQKELTHRELPGKKELITKRACGSLIGTGELTAEELAKTLAIPHQGGADEAPLKQAYRGSALMSHRSTASRGSTSFLLIAFLPICLCILSIAILVSFSLVSTLHTLELPRVHDRLAIGFKAEELVEKDVFNNGFWKKELGKKTKKNKKLSPFWEEETEKHKELHKFLWDLSLAREFEAQLANRWLQLRHLRQHLQGQLRVCPQPRRAFDLSICSLDFFPFLAIDDLSLVHQLRLLGRQELHDLQLSLRSLDALSSCIFALDIADLHLSFELEPANFLSSFDALGLAYETAAFHLLCFDSMLDSFYIGKFLQLVHVDLVLSIFTKKISFIDIESKDHRAKELEKATNMQKWLEKLCKVLGIHKKHFRSSTSSFLQSSSSL